MLAIDFWNESEIAMPDSSEIPERAAGLRHSNELPESARMKTGSTTE
jgi:hypothetical protein